MITATLHASSFTHNGFANTPILCGSLVNATSGNTANGSCRLSTTWLRMMSGPVPRSPYIATTMIAGTMAMRRVMSRRSHGRRRMLMNPSITIWPASVPVSVAFWPEQSSATANSTLAIVVPRSGESSSYASPMSATSWWPVPWNTAAAITRIAALMKSADISATEESIVE